MRVAAVDRGLLLSLLLISLMLPASAYVVEERWDKNHLSIFAPDWTWQKRDINILITLENTGPSPIDCTVDLLFPTASADHFRYAGATSLRLQAQAGASARDCFKGIIPHDGVSPQDYEFQLHIQGSGIDKYAIYPLKTVRGAVVNPGLWALYLPAGIALAWCLIVALVLHRMALPGAWKRPGAAITQLPNTPKWVAYSPAKEETE